MSYIRQGALACPSCGSRRIIRGMLFCDQCGRRIPDSLLNKSGDSKIESVQHDEPSTPSRRAFPILRFRRSDDVGRSGPTSTPSDSTIKSELVSIARGQEVPHMKGVVTPATSWSRQQVLGVFLVAFGVVTALASVPAEGGNLGGLGLASFLIGLLLICLHSGPSYGPMLVEASVLSSVANIERVLRDFGPNTRAVYLKIRDRLDTPMIFLPLNENPAPPSGLGLTDEDAFLLVDPDDPHKTGLLLEAPGASLLSLLEKECGLNYADSTKESFLDPLRSGMIETLDLASDVKATSTPEGMKLRIKDGALAGLSRSIASSSPKVASRLGCPICSAAICAAVKAMKTDTVLEEVIHQSEYHMVTLRFVRGVADEIG